MKVHDEFRKFLAQKYGSAPDPRTPERDITCTMMGPDDDAKAQTQLGVYAANMRRGGGTVVETAWKFDPGPPVPPAGPKPVTLPADPRIASATPQMRRLLEDRKRAAGNMCELEEGSAQQKVYDCECYKDRVVIETLDENSMIVSGGRDEQANILYVLSPPIELVAPRADVHTCMDQTILPARAYAKGMEMTGMWQGEAKKRLARCVADGMMAAQKAHPAHNIREFDSYEGTAFMRCASEVPKTP